MNDVKRFSYAWGHIVEDEDGEYVLHTDYAAVKAERNELARLASKLGNHKTFGFCLVCERALSNGHSPGCPVGLAERILKETPNER